MTNHLKPPTEVERIICIKYTDLERELRWMALDVGSRVRELDKHNAMDDNVITTKTTSLLSNLTDSLASKHFQEIIKKLK